MTPFHIAGFMAVVFALGFICSGALLFFNMTDQDGDEKISGLAVLGLIACGLALGLCANFAITGTAI